MADIGLYIHFPFCKSKCAYCDFYSLPLCGQGEQLGGDYISALSKAFEPVSGAKVSTLYFGGGNPLAMGQKFPLRLLDAAAKAFDIAGDAEISIEANPEDLSAEAAADLRRSGFNRLSIGIQSMNDGRLALLGRRHSAAAARLAVENAANAGFDNISADLMLGLPGETPQDSLQSLAAVFLMPVSHISAYMLKIERGTPFYERRETLCLPDPDRVADSYLETAAACEANGFAQYEISNFAKAGKSCRHNMGYWQLLPYLGFGPGAHSFFDGRRFFYPRSLAGFIAAPLETANDGQGGGAEEYITLSLRLTKGLELAKLEAQGTPLSADAAAFIEAVCRAGQGRLENGVFSLTPSGFLVSNEITARLLLALGL